jgi:crossover junction endodeoxyribonuclease RusA
MTRKANWTVSTGTQPWQDEDAKLDFARENPTKYWPRQVAFHVAGQPAVQGSKRAWVPLDKNGNPFRRPGGSVVVNVIEDSKSTRPWRALVNDAARGALAGGAPFRREALRLECVFALARPKGHYTARGTLRPSAPIAPAVKPDYDKLVRAIGDSLKGVLYDDDSRIVHSVTSKVYAADAQSVGVAIWLRAVDAAEVMAAELRYTSLAGGGQRQPELATGG